MKVKELIEKLGEYPPEMEVIWAIDDEGNDYHKMWHIGGTMDVSKELFDKGIVEPYWNEYDDEYDDDDDEDGEDNEEDEEDDNSDDEEENEDFITVLCIN